MLVLRVDGEPHLGPRLEVDLRPDERRVRGRGRGRLLARHPEPPHEYLHDGAVVPHHGQVAVVLEVRVDAEGRARQRRPQLDAVQAGRTVLRRRLLRVGDAPARRHEVELARPDRLERADGVAVQDLALEEPAHRLQPGVRVGWHLHALAARDVVRAVVVAEAPRPHERPGALRDRAPHVHRPRPAERHVARGEELDAVALLARDADLLGRLGLQVAHAPSLDPVAGVRGGARAPGAGRGPWRNRIPMTRARRGPGAPCRRHDSDVLVRPGTPGLFCTNTSNAGGLPAPYRHLWRHPQPAPRYGTSCRSPVDHVSDARAGRYCCSAPYLHPDRRTTANVSIRVSHHRQPLHGCNFHPAVLNSSIHR